jgi:hypothetical protein
MRLGWSPRSAPDQFASAVNLKQGQRLMREDRTLNASEGQRDRLGYFEVTRPDELWHMDMTSVSVSDTGTLTFGTDNGPPTPPERSAPDSHSLRSPVAAMATATREPSIHRVLVRKLKQRCVWRAEFETLDEARHKVNMYVNNYHHRSHPSGRKQDRAVAVPLMRLRKTNARWWCAGFRVCSVVTDLLRKLRFECRSTGRSMTSSFVIAPARVSAEELVIGLAWASTSWSWCG